MRKYTYIDTRTGERVYSDLPLRKTYFTKVTEIRGGTPDHMEKSRGVIRRPIKVEKARPAKTPKRVMERIKAKKKRTVSPIIKKT